MIKSFKGNTPRIAESAFVSEAAYVVGDVEIGENSSVWPGAVVRGDFGRITIGYNTAIEDNCVLHSGSPTTPPILDLSIGDNVVIGHGAVVNCKSIGSNVLIGINATLLHNAEIGDYCIIGAACLITHEMKVPDNSFVVGIPAKIKGKITPQQLYWVEQSP
ncbi:MAG: gamma carbonic anhydrase family protein, partial [Deltaproteobacteria bacterium]|nr:gamma carbonic anhydrase family protein [Deltaproteobacteria bacterium]